MVRKAVLTAFAWAVFATAAHAGDPALIATAPSANDSPSSAASTPPPASDQTPKQISAWISADGEGVVTQEGDQAPVRQPRQIHGEIEAEAGTGGYHGVAGVADIPIGENSDLVVAASNTGGRFRGGPGFQNNSLAIGLFLNGTKPAPSCAQPRFGMASPMEQARDPSCQATVTAEGEALPAE